MSSYVKATNFATKDTLPTGDSNKIVKGTEIDNELNAIAGAISSKADLASPTFTGTAAAPTATAGSNTTQLANTAYVKVEVEAERTSTTTLTNKTLTSPTINGGTISGITDLAIADGGTGASTAANARANLSVPTRTGGDASGTWAINVTGSSATATSATTAGFANNGVRAWAIYSTSSGLVRGYNISSVSAGTLAWTFNFSSAMSNSNYGIAMTHSPTNGADIYNRPCNISSWNSSSVTVNSPGGGTPAYIWITIFDY